MINFKKIRDKQLAFLISLIIVLSCFLIADTNLAKKVVSVEREYPVNSESLLKKIPLPIKSDYVVKIKYQSRKMMGAMVWLNQYPLEMRASNVSNKLNVTCYYYAPKDKVMLGDNVFEIKFHGEHPSTVTVRMNNYVAAVADNNIIISLANSVFKNKAWVKLFFFGIILFGCVFWVWRFLVFMGMVLFHESFQRSTFNTALSFSPCTLLFFILSIKSYQGPYLIAISPGYLLLLFVLLTGFTNAVLNLIHVLILRKVFPSIKREYILPTARVEIPPWLIGGGKWFKKRSLADKCIIFCLFVFSCSVFLFMLGVSKWGEPLANVAYTSVLIGISMKLFSLTKK
ncbi:MAG: hypothetical protein GY853_04345 [PVC group bacterium]|nr:hypothetical protein [PVC group bacterium]